MLVAGAMTVGIAAVSAYDTPAEAAAGLTGQSVEQVIAERHETGKTYGEIAGEAGMLEEFESEMLQIRKNILTEKVENGTLTQNEADEILRRFEENSENCDGTGSDRLGQSYKIGFGSGNGNFNGNETGLCDGTGTGLEDGSGYGSGNSNGNGNGLRDGTGTGLEDGSGYSNGRGNGLRDGTGAGLEDGSGYGNGNGSGLRDGSCS